MITRSATIRAANGLHARPAAVFVEAVEATGVDVTITFDGEEADASSLLEVMTLGAEHGDEVQLSAEDGNEEALDRLAELLVKGEA
uniref:HPr family phosphocarrier protein n=1 Tax=Tessaracoccus timonensis TaxID=2161816 RepID=UPI000D55E6F9|nr:HPr family phosphocarrier protein [Tessaracoccus timonensis]